MEEIKKNAPSPRSATAASPPTSLRCVGARRKKRAARMESRAKGEAEMRKNRRRGASRGKDY